MRLEIKIINALGLHARAAARFAQTAGNYGSRISVQLAGKDEVVDAKGIMGVMMLGAGRGTELIIDADGDDASEALDALRILINERFGEAE